jgi:hypothetical protein
LFRCGLRNEYRLRNGRWWLDPLAALALVPFVVRERWVVLRARSFDDACCGRDVNLGVGD